MKPLITLYLVALSCLRASPVHCYADEQNFEFRGQDDFCAWLQPKEMWVKVKYCTLSLVGLACPDACLNYPTTSCEDADFCCRNDPTFTFKRRNGKIKWCGWLTTRKKNQRKMYCDTAIENGPIIRDKCRGICDNCDDAPISAPPSPAPAPVTPWSFIVLADWHKAEYFATEPSRKTEYYIETKNQIRFVNQTYGGDFVLMPGDTNGALPAEKGGGKWDKEEFEKIFKPHLSVQKRIKKAGKNCYNP